MLKIFFIFLSIVFIPIFNSKGAEICQRTQRNVPIEMDLNYGNVEYLNNKSNSNFQSYLYKETGYRPKLPSQVRGITFAASSISVQGKGKISQLGIKEYCVELDNVKIQFGYDRIIVLIDRKYRPGSCEYKAIKEHEDQHVFLHRDTLRFYSKYVHDEAYKVSQQILPRLVSSENEAKKALEDMVEEIQRAVLPINEFFMKIKDEENLKIDTPESYEKSTKRCRNW